MLDAIVNAFSHRALLRDDLGMAIGDVIGHCCECYHGPGRRLSTDVSGALACFRELRPPKAGTSEDRTVISVLEHLGSGLMGFGGRNAYMACPLGVMLFLQREAGDTFGLAGLPVMEEVVVERSIGACNDDENALVLQVGEVVLEQLHGQAPWSECLVLLEAMTGKGKKAVPERVLRIDGMAENVMTRALMEVGKNEGIWQLIEKYVRELFVDDAIVGRIVAAVRSSAPMGW